MPFLIEEADFSRELESVPKNYALTKSLLEKGVENYRIKGLTLLLVEKNYEVHRD